LIKAFVHPLLLNLYRTEDNNKYLKLEMILFDFIALLTGSNFFEYVYYNTGDC